MLRLIRRIVKHPLVAATVLCVSLASTLSFVFYHYEKNNPNGEFDTYPKTVQQILKLILSGFDAAPPESSVAIACSYFLVLVGIVYIGLFTALITAEIVAIKGREGLVKKTSFENHILLCGWVKRPRAILDQLFAEDLNTHRPVVIISPDIKSSPMVHSRLATIKGDPTDAAVLKQANARRAHSAIILADREDQDTNAADARSLLIALAIKAFNKDIFTCAEVLNPANEVHFRRAKVDEEISVAKVGISLVVQSTLNPGLSRVLTDMLTFGAGEELYKLPVPKAFIGRSFADLGATLMDRRTMILVGVTSEDGKRIVNSYRAKHIFQKDDYIFVLAEDEPVGLHRLKFKKFRVRR